MYKGIISFVYREQEHNQFAGRGNLALSPRALYHMDHHGTQCGVRLEV